MIWIRNSRGKPDALLTFALAGTAVVLVRVLVGGIGPFPQLDAGLAALVLGATLAPYTTKRTFGGKEDAKP